MKEDDDGQGAVRRDVIRLANPWNTRASLSPLAHERLPFRAPFHISRSSAASSSGRRRRPGRPRRIDSPRLEGDQFAQIWVFPRRLVPDARSSSRRKSIQSHLSPSSKGGKREEQARRFWHPPFSVPSVPLNWVSCQLNSFATRPRLLPTTSSLFHRFRLLPHTSQPLDYVEEKRETRSEGKLSITENTQQAPPPFAA